MLCMCMIFLISIAQPSFVHNIMLVITPRTCAKGKVIGCGVVVVVIVVSTKIGLSRDVGL